MTSSPRGEDEQHKGQQAVSKTSLNVARKARKLAEREVRALENRILLLKKEEDRARQRIEQTKKRAEDIVRMREENMRRKKLLQSERAAQKVGGADPKVIKQRFMEKELAKAARRKYLDEVYKKKQAEAQNFRSEKKQYERDLTKQKRQSQAEARRKKDLVKRQREEAWRRIQHEREKQRVQTRLEYKKRIESENAAVRSFESKAQQLERLEQELIERLQHTQQVQHQAYVELEEALTSADRPAAAREAPAS